MGFREREAKSEATAENPDEFVGAVEQKRPEERTLEERIAFRAEGRSYQLLSYRGTERQKALIDFAAAEERLSIQRLLDGILMPTLEERYGEKFDAS